MRSNLGVVASAHVAGGFSPSDISGLIAWYDADAITGLSDTDAVETWADLSGNGNAVTATTFAPTYRTNIQNGLPVVRFNGTSHVMNGDLAATITGARSIVTALRTPPSTASGINAWLAGSGATGNGWLQSMWATSTGRFISGISADSGRFIEFSDTSLRDAVGVHSFTAATGGSAKLRVNGTERASGSVTFLDAAAVRLGAQRPADRYALVDLYEMALYDRELTTTEVGDVESYLKTKWGTP